MNIFTEHQEKALPLTGQGLFSSDKNLAHELPEGVLSPLRGPKSLDYKTLGGFHVFIG